MKTRALAWIIGLLAVVALIATPACGKKGGDDNKGGDKTTAKKGGDKGGAEALPGLPDVCQKVAKCCTALSAKVSGVKSTCDATIDGYKKLAANKDIKPDFAKLCGESLKVFQANPNAPDECK